MKTNKVAFLALICALSIIGCKKKDPPSQPHVSYGPYCTLVSATHNNSGCVDSTSYTFGESSRLTQVAIYSVCGGTATLDRTKVFRYLPGMVVVDNSGSNGSYHDTMFVDASLHVLEYHLFFPLAGPAVHQNTYGSNSLPVRQVIIGVSGQDTINYSFAGMDLVREEASYGDTAIYTYYTDKVAPTNNLNLITAPYYYASAVFYRNAHLLRSASYNNITTNYTYLYNPDSNIVAKISENGGFRDTTAFQYMCFVE